MFNLQGSELVIILLLALVVLGPEKLPDAMRRAGKLYADLRKMSSSFQDEFKSAMEEPMREMRDTADLLRDSADFTKLQADERPEKPKSAEMRDAPSITLDDEDDHDEDDHDEDDHDVDDHDVDDDGDAGSVDRAHERRGSGEPAASEEHPSERVPSFAGEENDPGADHGDAGAAATVAGVSAAGRRPGDVDISELPIGEASGPEVEGTPPDFAASRPRPFSSSQRLSSTPRLRVAERVPDGDDIGDAADVESDENRRDDDRGDGAGSAQLPAEDEAAR